MPDLRRQNLGIPLRDFQLRVVQGLFQTHGTKPQELRVLEGGGVPGDGRHQEEVPRVQVRQVPAVRDETRR